MLSSGVVRQTEVRSVGAAPRAPSHAFWVVAGLVGFSIVLCGFAPSYIGGAFIAFGDSSLLGGLVHTSARQHFAASLVT
jgi:hypothetical protein